MNKRLNEMKEKFKRELLKTPTAEEISIGFSRQQIMQQLYPGTTKNTNKPDSINITKTKQPRASAERSRSKEFMNVTIKRRPAGNKDLDVQEKDVTRTQLTTVKKIRPAPAIDACRASI